MKKPKFNKKIILPIIIGVVLVVGFIAIFNAAQVNAQGTTNTETTGKGLLGSIMSGVATWFFRLLGSVLAAIGSLILNNAMKVFQYTLTAGLNGHSEIARVGWTVSRDIANMFFILFMVVIAFATILRIERYGAKQLLPKIIIIALLINFSMVLCYVLIDFTNIAANYFITNAQISATGTKVELSQIFLDGLQIPRTMTAAICDQYIIKRDDCARLFANGNPMDIPACQFQAQRDLERCHQEMTAIQATATEDEDIMHVIVAQIGSAIVIFIAAFIVLAGAVLMIVRSIAIWFFVIISPLAFICYILPSLRRNWESWLTQFTRWCIFAPAYAFFLWLTAKICTQEAIEKIGIVQNSGFTDRASMVNQFFSDPQYMFGFMFIAGFLIASLIVANKLGVYGANIAMSVGKKWSGAATGWMKKQTVGRAKERAGGGLDRARGAALTRAGSLFGGDKTKLGRSLAARGTIASQSAAQREYNKKYAARLSMMSKEDNLKEIETASGTQRLLAARNAQNRGFMREATNKQTAVAMAAFAKFGDVDSARKLAELKPLAVGNEKDRSEAIERARVNGTIRQWDENTIIDPDKKNDKGDKTYSEEEVKAATNIMDSLSSKMGSVGELSDLITKNWTKGMRDNAVKLMQRSTAPLSDYGKLSKEQMDNDYRKREAIKKISGDMENAYFTGKNGEKITKIGGEEKKYSEILLDHDGKYDDGKPTYDANVESMVQKSILNTSAEDFNKLSESSKKLAARFMQIGQVDQWGFGASAQNKNILRDGLMTLIRTLREDRKKKGSSFNPEKEKLLISREKLFAQMNAKPEYWGTPEPEFESGEKERKQKPDDFGKGRPKFDF